MNDLRTLPLAILAWGGAVAGISEKTWPIALLLAVVAALIHFGQKGARRILVAAALVGLVSFGLAATTSSLIHQGPLAKAGQEHATLSVQARITSDPVVKGAETRFVHVSAPVMITKISGKENYRTNTPAELISADQDLISQPVGQTIQVVVKAAPGRPATKVAARLAIKGTIKVVKPPDALATLTNKLRAGLRNAMANSSSGPAGLVPSFVVGDTSHLDENIKDDFKATGLTHLTAVSGTNLTLLLGFVLPLLRLVGVRGWWLHLSAAFCVAIFILVCRGEPSVLRAGVMGIVGLAAIGRNAGAKRGLRHLGTAVLVLTIIDPWLALSFGFGLSVVACGAILWWASAWQLKLRTWLPGFLAEAIAVPLAAQIATQPIITYLGGEISSVGLLANGLSGPFVGPVTVLGMATTLISLVSPSLALLTGQLAGWFVQPIILIAHFLATLDGARWQWLASPISITALTIFCLLIGWAIGWLLTQPALVGLLALTLIAAMVFPPLQLGVPSQWLMVTCDVGQGDARIVRTGSSSAILIDAGVEPSSVMTCLRTFHVNELSAIFITHRHADHIGGLAQVVAKFPQAPVYAMSPLKQTQSTALGVGDELRIGDATWRTLGGQSLGSFNQGEDANENDASMVGLVTVDGVKILFPGDLEEDGQRRLVADQPDLKADLLAMPHHGSAKQYEPFFAAVGAKAVVISVGRNNEFGHPTASALHLANTHGMAIYRTDESGWVAFSKDKERLVATTGRQSHEKLAK